MKTRLEAIQELLPLFADGSLWWNYTFVQLVDGEIGFGPHQLMRIDETTSVERWLEIKPQDPEAYRYFPAIHTSLEPIDCDAVRAGQRLLVNFALYLDTLRRDGAWPGKRGAPGGPLTDAPERGFTWDVGREIKLSPHLREAAKTAVNRGPAWRVRSRFAVRGHWRNQAHGTGRKERRMTWIAPHWKGPEGAEALRKVYEVL